MAPHTRPVLAGNWKMNLGPTAAGEFVRTFLSLHPSRSDGTVLLFPPALSLAAVRAALADRNDIRVGVQNIHAEEKGAFTGENSASIAKDAGAAYVLVGHSERRHVFGETDAEVARKCAKSVEHGMVPVLCVGEKIEQREHGETEEVVLHQLRAGLSALTHEQILGAIVAYEPVWAIGTGRTATPDDAAAVHRVIRAALTEMVGSGAADIPFSTVEVCLRPTSPHCSLPIRSMGFWWVARASIRAAGQVSAPPGADAVIPG
jgi:triosephosphate isomerase